MKLFFYYAFHSVKNQIRKLFRTWVAVFFAVCVLFGMIIGFGAASIESLLEGDDVVDAEPGEDFDEELPPEDELPEELLPEELSPEEAQAQMRDRLDLIVTVALLLLFAFEIMNADKSGSNIFPMADVNLLFSSPMRPQAVLLFRLCCQMGTMVFLGIYLLIEVPIMMDAFGLSPLTAATIILTFALAVMFGKLINVLLYTLASVHALIKKFLRPTLYAVLIALAGGFVLFWQQGTATPWTALGLYLKQPWVLFIPVVGQLKGLVVFSAEQNIAAMAICGGVLVLALIGIIVAVRHTKADFYEEAMAKSEETAALQRAAQESGGVAVKRKKDRAEKLMRDGMKHGWGANVFFFKAMYNRFRFGHLHYFTKTAETYLVLSLGVSLIVRFTAEDGGYSIVPVALAIAAFAFFRSLGNPLTEDTQKDFFLMIPCDPWAKMLWSLLGGMANCALDVLPAMLLATVLLGANPLAALAWLLFVVTLDVYSTAVATFLDLAIPVSIGKPVKQAIQIMFIYFGLLPDIALLIIGAAFGGIAIGAAIAAVVNVAVGALFFALSPLFLVRGRK